MISWYTLHLVQIKSQYQLLLLQHISPQFRAVWFVALYTNTLVIYLHPSTVQHFLVINSFFFSLLIGIFQQYVKLFFCFEIFQIITLREFSICKSTVTFICSNNLFTSTFSTCSLFSLTFYFDTFFFYFCLYFSVFYPIFFIIIFNKDFTILWDHLFIPRIKWLIVDKSCLICLLWFLTHNYWLFC